MVYYHAIGSMLNDGNQDHRKSVLHKSHADQYIRQDLAVEILPINDGDVSNAIDDDTNEIASNRENDPDLASCHYESLH